MNNNYETSRSSGETSGGCGMNSKPLFSKKVRGKYRTNISVVRPPIFVSPDTSEHDSELKSIPKQRYISNIGSQHFYVVLTAYTHYSPEDIECCNSKYKCYNCTQPIFKRIYFYPEKRDNNGTFYMNCLPHCCRECTLRTVMDINNNHHLISLFYFIYGKDVLAAPSRALLFIPGGLSIEEYHKRIKESTVVQIEKPNFRQCFSPMYVSSTLYKDHKLVENVVDFIDELSKDNKSIIGPSKERDNSQLVVKEIRNEKLSKGLPARIFAIDKSSFMQNNQQSKNPHLK